MAIEIDERGLAASWELNTGACSLRADAMPLEDALVMFGAVRAALYGIRHPEEPTEPLPSFVSEPNVRDGGVELRFDIADAEAYDGLLEKVLRVVVQAIEEAGVQGGRVSVPIDPDEVDAETAHRVLANFRDDGVPLGWYDDLPIPTTLQKQSSARTSDQWKVELRTATVPAEELANFYERALVGAGCRVEGWLEIRAQTWRYTASIFFARDGDRGMVQVTDFGDVAGVDITGYAAGSKPDYDWRSFLADGDPLSDGFEWRIAPTFGPPTQADHPTP